MYPCFISFFHLFKRYFSIFEVFIYPTSIRSGFFSSPIPLVLPENSSGSPQVAYRHHFGLGSRGGPALGLPPQGVSASERCEGLHFEAAVLEQLHSSKRVEAELGRTAGVPEG